MADAVKAVFSIVTKSYLHFARALMISVEQNHPDWARFVLLVDEIGSDFVSLCEIFEAIEVSRLPLPHPKKFFFRYTRLELCTAVKPWMAEWLFDRGFQQVIYLDPDIFVYRPLKEVETLLAGGALMVITPHLTGRLDDQKRPDELDIMRSGAYNLGFIGLRVHPRLRDFLRWWQSKLEFQCTVDFKRGLFTDQKWIDLAPGMFPDVAILRHPGYNVAYWNLKHRQVEKRLDGLYVNGEPLVFFHYSGIDPAKPSEFSKHQDRYTIADLRDAEPLVRGYCALLQKTGSADCTSLEFAYDRFDDGTPISDFIRRCYRINLHLHPLAGENPFAAKHIYNLPAKDLDRFPFLVSELMKTVWEEQEGLRALFPDINRIDRIVFARWFVQAARAELKIDHFFVEPVQAGLDSMPEMEDTTIRLPSTLRNAARYRLTKLMASEDEAFVTNAYRTLLQRLPDREGLAAYLAELRAGVSKIEILTRLRNSPEGRHLAVHVSGLDFFSLLERLRRHSPRPLKAILEYIAHRPPAPELERPADTQGKRISFSLYSGFWDDEMVPGRKSAWMGQSAMIKLGAVKAGNRLRIRGEYDADSQHKANGTPLTMVYLYLNGAKTGELRLVSNGEFEHVCTLTTDRRRSLLRLEASQTFIPAKIGSGEDPRELALKIGRIEIEGQTVLDFSDIKTPYQRHISATAAGLNLVGYATSVHGIGESVRIAANCCKAAELPFVVISTPTGSMAGHQGGRGGGRFYDGNPYPANIFHINADQMPVVHDELGQRFFDHHYNIGYWHWELPVFPDRFLSSFDYLDEVWVPSRFVLDAVSAKSPIPVLRIPHAIDIPSPQGATRNSFGLPEKGFCFLVMYDLRSRQERKNPQAVLTAFDLAFQGAGDCHLVIKVQNGDECPDDLARLKEWIGHRKNVHLIAATFNRQEVYGLESVCDCFISLHRSEGFGLALAESMFLGKPVIATDWSGNTDFMNAMNSLPVRYELVQISEDIGPYEKGQWWADPDVEHAAWLMKQVAVDASLRQKVAARGRKTIRENHSPRSVARQYRERLTMIALP